MHSLQVNYIHQLVQARLMENDKPLDDLYNVLRILCKLIALCVILNRSCFIICDLHVKDGLVICCN